MRKIIKSNSVKIRIQKLSTEEYELCPGLHRLLSRILHMCLFTFKFNSSPMCSLYKYMVAILRPCNTLYMKCYRSEVYELVYDS